MLDTLTAALTMTSANLLVLSYFTPDKEPRSLTTVVTYDKSLKYLGHITMSVTLSGGCFLADEVLECPGLNLGPNHPCVDSG